MFETFRKLRARLSYKKKLRPYLIKTYGTRCDYSADEVRSGIEQLGLNPLYISYGLALCSSQADFNSYHQTVGQDCSYESVRGEIGGDGASWFSGFSGDAFDSGGSDLSESSSFDGGYDNSSSSDSSS